MAQWFVMMLLVVVVGCSKEDFTENIPKAEVKSRLVLAYMIADNDLSPYVDFDINEMEKGKFLSKDSTNTFLVYVDKSQYDTPAHPYLLEIKADTTNQIVSEVVHSFPELNSAQGSQMRKVIDLVLERYRNRSSMGLILWSHGNAWYPEGVNLLGLSTEPSNTLVSSNQRLSLRTKSFGLDESSESQQQMSITDLKESLSGVQLDYLLMDACFMGSVEVAYELREITPYFVGTSTEILVSGFPYEKIFSHLFQTEFNPIAVSDSIFQFYDQKTGAYQSAGIVALEMAKLERLSEVTADVLKQIKLNWKEIEEIYEKVQALDRNKEPKLFDFKHWLGLLAGTSQVDMTEFNTLWSELIMYEKHTSALLEELKLEEVYGLSTYLLIPNKDIQNANFYKKTDWYTASGYARFVGDTR